jgi:predicted PurR-regulated permease PerM
MVRLLLNDYIKKLIIILLTVVTVYVLFLVYPYIFAILGFVFKIVFPFLIAFAIAFILQPMVNYFQKLGVKRWLSVIIVISIFIFIVALIIVLTVPKLLTEMKQIIIEFPQITERIKIIVNDFAKRFDFLPDGYQPNFDNLNGFLNKYVIKLEQFPGTLITKIGSVIGFIVLVPMILIYFLLDYEKILCNARNFLIKKNMIRFKEYLADLNNQMGRYFRGIFIVVLIVSIAFSIAFYIVDLKFAIFFALILGFTNVIPYLGSYIGAVLPVGFALTESPQKALVVIIICIIIQTLESDLLTPYIHGRRTNIHPLIVMLGLLVFGALFGIIGMMIAVPILLIVKITLQHYPLKIKKTSFIK